MFVNSHWLVLLLSKMRVVVVVVEVAVLVLSRKVGRKSLAVELVVFLFFVSYYFDSLNWI